MPLLAQGRGRLLNRHKVALRGVNGPARVRFGGAIRLFGSAKAANWHNATALAPCRKATGQRNSVLLLGKPVGVGFGKLCSNVIHIAPNAIAAFVFCGPRTHCVPRGGNSRRGGCGCLGRGCLGRGFVLRIGSHFITLYVVWRGTIALPCNKV